MITKHKIIKWCGKSYCLCPTPGKKVMAYHWKNVNCQKCLEYNEVGFTDRQMSEIARIRSQKSWQTIMAKYV